MAITDEEALHHHVEDPARRGAQSTPSEDRRVKQGIPQPPTSTGFRLPVKLPDVQKKPIPPPLLLHPVLHRVPMHVRFGLNGFLSNVFFMIAYNVAVGQFGEMATPSTIYSIVYFIFIPVTHAMLSLIVFGWPERYLPSLMSNAPIGLTAIALGAALTAYLDKMQFNKLMVKFIARQWNLLGYEAEPSAEDEHGEFYSSLVVLFVTGIWTFALSVLINSQSEPSDKKEL